jgi:hypothetical protein
MVANVDEDMADTPKDWEPAEDNKPILNLDLDEYD